MVTAKLPTASVVTSVNGLAVGSTPETLCGIVLTGGLEFIVGKVCWNAAVSPGLATNVVGVEFSAKKFPLIGVVAIGWIGLIQVTLTVFENTVVVPLLA